MPDDTRPLRRIVGPYICEELLSTSMSDSVYMAHTRSGDPVALRIITISEEVVETTARFTMLLQELSAIAISNIIPILDYGSDDNTLYIATPMIAGYTLEERIRTAVAGEIALPSLSETLRYLEPLVEAIDSLHAMGVLHGQITPRSILLDAQGQPYLQDVGLTRIIKVIYGLDRTSTFTVSAYSAPEIWESGRPVLASDQYSLACIIYEVLTGRPPFTAPSIHKLMQQHLDDVALPPHYLRRDLPSDLSLAFWRAMAKPPDRRFPSLTAFWQELYRAAGSTDDIEGHFFAPPFN